MSISSAIIKLFATIAIVSSVVSGAPADNLQAQALTSHNNYRAIHHVAGLRWSQVLADHATSVSQSCIFQHNVAQGTGQNLAQGHQSMEDAVKAWYDEAEFYDYNASGPMYSNREVRHFTQVVWKDTTEIGCGVTYCENLNQQHFYVCDYSSPGNYKDSYAANVFRP
ncbi:hypothetical protein INT47_002972 [Mucor saturninus]|uniref:SCP domain-containing protein n=1 Tax=Mucor saturninus TaxID=64648 RepID=A0A8H7UW64_9FUNG|nr:hypothetical protein INT47_002972 [Mucor saturninus]